VQREINKKGFVKKPIGKKKRMQWKERGGKKRSSLESPQLVKKNEKGGKKKKRQRRLDTKGVRRGQKKRGVPFEGTAIKKNNVMLYRRAVPKKGTSQRWLAWGAWNSSYGEKGRS